MTIYKVDFLQECDDWGEPVHVHFYEECPVCHAKEAGTSVYGAIWEFKKYGGETFWCLECHTKFILESYNFDDDPQATIRVIEEK